MSEAEQGGMETEGDGEHSPQKYTVSLRPDRNENDHERERYLQPPIEIQSRHYSLDPDCVGGWKPKNLVKPKPKYVHVFPLRYDQEIVDDVIKQLIKNKAKHHEALIYLGPRRTNSFALHQNRPYQNPYRLEGSMSPSNLGRAGIGSGGTQLRTSFLKFNSDFQSGNLDAVVQRSSDEFDLFMRVDSNTRGHTNWFYFQVENGVFIGSITFTICNFRRPASLYQRGLRPYVWSKLMKEAKWSQQGENVKYEKQRLRYRFLYEDSQQSSTMLGAFYALTFTFKFELPHDTVRFAYSPPYEYSLLNHFLKRLEGYKALPPLKSLSGLPIPVLRITDEQDDAGKKAVLVTARIHPGESNSSYVAEGFLEQLCGTSAVGKELRAKYIFFVVPMVNPDGVVAGNYRTSLFGKDLNRTFDQSRRYAFPETFHLLRLAEELKKTHKKRFCLYLDLHGHSIKKNVFMYGPGYALQDYSYEISRELPRLLSSLTPFFRYYSCSFRISDSKTATARAVLNRSLKVPYTYTMESSNSSYFDFATHTELPFRIEHWREMGAFLAIALNSLKLEKLPKISRTYTLKTTKSLHCADDKPSEPISDDDICENDSDIEPEAEDLPEEMLYELEQAVRGNEEEQGRSFDASQSAQPPTDKKKQKKRKPEALTKRQPKPHSNEKPEPREPCAYQIPERKNINFPSVFPLHRAEIFINRQSRHDRHEIPQMRFRKNESQTNKKLEGNTKNSVSSNKIAMESEYEMSQEWLSKKELNFNDLIKKYKFNF